MNININSRFKDAPWYIESTKESILLVGLGGIGGNSLYCLSKTIPAKYFLVDNDVVTDYNVGCQFFTESQIGKPKIEAIIETMKNQSLANFMPFKKMFSNEYLPITITALDNISE